MTTTRTLRGALRAWYHRHIVPAEVADDVIDGFDARDRQHASARWTRSPLTEENDA